MASGARVLRTVPLTVMVAAVVTVLGAGVVMERRAAYRNYAYGLIAGGWAGTYFTTYAMRAVGEGYEFGGGCYRLNGYDDTPGAPTDGGGEGADCSGFTVAQLQTLNFAAMDLSEFYASLVPMLPDVATLH